MPNQRRKGQILVGFQSDVDFVAKIDRGRGRDSRSLFIRQAVAEKLQSLGIQISDDLVFPADRAVRIAESDASNAAPVQNRQPVDYRKTAKTARKVAKKGT